MPGPFTSDIHFTWNANVESDVANYKLYAGQASGTYTHSGSPKTMGNVTSGTYTIDAPGPWFFALTCLDSSNNESAKSTEVTRSFFLCGNF